MSQRALGSSLTTTGSMASGSPVLNIASPLFLSSMVGYNVTVFGAAAGTTATGDGHITIAQKVLTSASNPFTSGMVGDHIKVVGAGAAGGDLITTIAVFTSSSSVTLTDAAGTTVTTANIVIYDGTLSTTILSVQSPTQATLAANSAADTAANAAVTIFFGGSADLLSSAYPLVVFSSPLTSTDTVTVKVVLPDGQAAVVANDLNGVNTGLSTTHPVRIYFGGPTYRLTKVGTAGASPLYVDFGTKEVG